jgi:hypothetical protein
LNGAEAVAGHSERRLLDFRSGGGLLLLSGLLCALTVGLWAQRLLDQPARVGDGRNVASYGFDLSTCLLPRDQIVAAGFSKDGLHAPTNPPMFTVTQAQEFGAELRRTHQGKFLVDSDRVIGVVVDGVARAYPLRILNWHEVVNDTVGGRPICVTYNPLCDSAVVFDRRVAGETLEFGVSGLLYNSNLLMYDRRPDSRGESLWSQLQFRAVTGPAAAAGRKLDVVPAAVLRWADWWAAHPETTILAPDPTRMKAYEQTYDAYFGSELLHFPVDPQPPADGWPLKTAVIAVRTTSDWHVFRVADIAAHAGGETHWDTTVDGTDVRFESHDVPSAAWVVAVDGVQPEVAYAFWFAWHASQADKR